MEYGIYTNTRDAAWQCLIDCGISELPIRPVRIAKMYGLQCKKCDDMILHGDSGQIKIIDDIVTIIFNTENTTQRQRYTIMHTKKENKKTEAITEKATEEITEQSVKEQPQEQEKTTEDPDAQVTVYYTKSGKKYHNENPCGRGKYYECTLAEAKAKGLSPCEKCVLH